MLISHYIDWFDKLLLLILHREEGTIPYIPELPVNAEAIINYNQSLYNVQGIHTSPAGLESTSLVLSYGLGKSPPVYRLDSSHNVFMILCHNIYIIAEN